MNEVLTKSEVTQLLGYKYPGLAEKKLRAQGITPIYGRKGHWFVTLSQINTIASGNIPQQQHSTLSASDIL